jgi:O-antigen/teichoic acid export membrane protein
METEVDPVTAASADILDTGAAGGKVIRGGVIRMGGFVLGLLLGLVSVPLMTNHLGVDDYGRYVTVSAIVFIIGGFTEAGLTNLGVREYATLRGTAREDYLRNLAGLRFALTAAGVVAAGLFTWVTGADTVVVEGTLIAGAGLLISLTQQTYSIPLAAKLRLGWITVLDLLKQALLTAFIVVFVIAGAGLLPFFVAGIGSALGMLVATLALLRGEASLRPRADLAVWRRVMRDVLPYALAAAVGLIYFRLGVVLMSYIASDHETGIYGTAFRVVEVMGVVPWITVSAAFPILARAERDDAERLRYALQRLFEGSTMIGAGIALCIGLGARFAIDVIAPAEFHPAIPVLRLLGLALVTSFLVATFSLALLSLRANRELLVCNAIAAVTTATAILTLEPLLDARGAALGTVIGEATLVISYAIALRRRSRDLAPNLRILPKVALAAGVGALAGLLPVHPVIATIAGAGAYVTMLFALRAVPPELLDALRRRAPELPV